jgi:glycosyltransferase involved in cell wall biosynthesis
VVFAGAVDDLAGHLKGGDVAVVPLRSGGGTRMKILDDFAAGVPVVTTAKGMEGLPVEDGRHLRIVEAPEDMAEVVAGLLADAGARQALADAAAEWVARYDWREIARRTAESVRAAG